MTRKREQPVAVCTQCGTFTSNPQSINERCYQQHGGKRWRGVFGSALNVGDWAECKACGATGRSGGERCPSCNGEGWAILDDVERPYYTHEILAAYLVSEAYAAELRASLRITSAHEKRDQDDDRNWNSEQPQQDRTHSDSPNR